MSKGYDLYLKQHRKAVKVGFKWMERNIGLECVFEILPDLGDISLFEVVQLNQHDSTKNNKDEYDAYDAYFYGPNGIKCISGVRSDIQSAFDSAWLLHQHRNPHHWQYWVLIEDDNGCPMKALEMPDRYILEMILDWWTFSWRSGDLYSILNWWNDHNGYILLGNETRRKVEMLLRLICDKLNEVGFDPEEVRSSVSVS